MASTPLINDQNDRGQLVSGVIREPHGIGANCSNPDSVAALNAVVGNNPCHLATSAEVHKLTCTGPLLIRVIHH